DRREPRPPRARSEAEHAGGTRTPHPRADGEVGAGGARGRRDAELNRARRFARPAAGPPGARAPPPGPLAQPGLQQRQAVLAPEGFAVHEEERSAEDAEADGLLGRGTERGACRGLRRAPCRLGGGRAEARREGLRRLERGEVLPVAEGGLEGLP